MRNQSGSSVNVEVDAKPQEDLSRVLDEIRRQYNGITDKNKKEIDAWYKAKVRKATESRHHHQISRDYLKAIALSNLLSSSLMN